MFSLCSRRSTSSLRSIFVKHIPQSFTSSSSSSRAPLVSLSTGSLGTHRSSRLSSLPRRRQFLLVTPPHSRATSASTAATAESRREAHVEHVAAQLDSRKRARQKIERSKRQDGHRKGESALKNVLLAYIGLSKARLGLLVLATTMAGYAAAPGPFVTSTFFICSFGTALTICSANAMNQWIEVEHDAKMLRTRRRMLPLSRISSQHALAFAVTTGVCGTGLLASQVSSLCALLAGGNILLYAFVYTPLKRIHWANTWIGAVVGAIPPVIGWVACTHATSLEPGALALGAVLFVWQIPHFLALAWTYREDYARAGYKMFGNAQAAKIAPVTFLWSVYLLAVGPLCAYTGVTDWYICLTLLPFTAHLIEAANGFLKQRTTKNSTRLFKSTLYWLPAALILILFHKKRSFYTKDEENEKEQ